MPRQRRSYEERIQDDIKKCEEKHKSHQDAIEELKKQKETLESELEAQKIRSLMDLMKKKNISIETLQSMVEQSDKN